MHPDLERLIDLQKIDSEIHRKRQLLLRLPKEIQEAAGALEEAQSKLKSFDDASLAEQKKRKDLEVEVESLKAKITADKQKLPAIKTNVEYRALLKELEGYERTIQTLEDEELNLMEKSEKNAAKRGKFEEAVTTEESAFSGVKADKESAIADLEKGVAELVEKRSSLIGGVSPNIFKSYERILSVRDGIGVAQVVEQTCQACHQIIPPQMYYNIRTTDEIFTCPHCNRYLYFIDVPDESGVANEPAQ